jgi:hypothetical protein
MSGYVDQKAVCNFRLQDAEKKIFTRSMGRKDGS